MDGCTRGRSEHHWPTARAEALERVGHACARCGRSDGLHVHHVEPCHGDRSDGCQHHQANLLVLCEFHHREEHVWLRLTSGRRVAVRQLVLPVAA